MIQHEIKANQRIQIELEHEDASYRCLKGIVVGVTSHTIVLLTDFGEAIEINQYDILSFATTNFSKPVSEVLQEMRNHYETIYGLKQEINEREYEFYQLKDELKDAHFLSRFNTVGARTRIEHTLPEHLKQFKAKDFEYEIYFEVSNDSQIEMNISVRKVIDYPQLNMDRDRDKIISAYAPDILEWLKKLFKARTIEVKEKNILHIEENLYAIKTKYKLSFDVDKDNFLVFRKTLFDSIEKLKH